MLSDKNYLRTCTAPEPITTGGYTAISTADQSVVLCQDDVIGRLTSTLPAALMVRANQNLNKVIDQRKQRLLKKSRDRITRSSLLDPRWQNLQGSLSNDLKY